MEPSGHASERSREVARASGILEDVLVHGAIPKELLSQRSAGGSLPAGDLLIGKGWLVGVPTPEGVAYVLSPRAKQWLGVHSTWVTRPDLAARQLLLRKIDAVLTQSGWLRAQGALPYPRYRDRAGRLIYVTASRNGLRSGTVRRMLDRHRAHLVREGAVLLVLTAHWRSLQDVAARSNGLLAAGPLSLTDENLQRLAMASISVK